MAVPGPLELAWRIAVHSPARLATALAGLAFACLLMLVQLGFRNALLESSAAVIDAMNADLVVLHVRKDSALERIRIPAARLSQAAGVPGVAAAWPLWIDMLLWTNPTDGAQRPIRVYGVRAGDPCLDLPELRRHADALRRPGTALMDRRARDEYGFQGPGPATLERRGLDVLDTVALGSDFEADGNVLVGERTFQLVTGTTRLDFVEFVLVKAAPGADPLRLRDALRAALPRDVAVYTRPELRARERAHWARATPVSIVFGVGTLVGFLVGVAICYQILFTDVSDHLRELATLRAIGHHDRWVRAVVLWEAAVLSGLAALPSLAAGHLVYSALAAATGLRMVLTPEVALVVVSLALVMNVVAGLLAMRRALQADPADVF